MELEYLKNLASGSIRLTANIKKQLVDEASKYNISVPNCKCRNKWVDLCVILYRAKKQVEKKDNTAPVIKTESKKYGYKLKYGVRVGGIIYDSNTDTLTIERLRGNKPQVFDKLYIKLGKTE